MFIVFEGVDGTGKTTQLQQCQQWLESRGHDVTVCRDPGSTDLGNRIRDVLLSKSDLRIAAESEMFLFMSARAQLVDEIILPALARNEIVLCDRFLLSTVVYQGRAGGLDPAMIWQIGNVATRNLHPDLTLVFDVPLEVALQRIGDRLDRMESRGEEFLASVQRGFLAESSNLPHAVVIDATGDPADVHLQVAGAVSRQLDAQTEKSR